MKRPTCKHCGKFKSAGKPCRVCRPVEPAWVTALRRLRWTAEPKGKRGERCE